MTRGGPARPDRALPVPRTSDASPMHAPRLLVLTPVFAPAIGGIETLTANVVDRWPGLVHVATLREDGSDTFDASAPYGVSRVRNVPRGGRKALARLALHAPLAARRFAPDIVWSTHVRCAPAAEAARALTGARWVQHYHAKEIPTWPRLTRWATLRSDARICVSRYTAGLLDKVCGAELAVDVIPPGIEPPDGPLSTEKFSEPTILTIARMDDTYKGHEDILAALPLVRRRHPAVVWKVVGSGRHQNELERRATELGLQDNVQFLGRVSDAERDDLLQRSWLFCLPSRTSDDGLQGEGFGIVYLEAARMGLPSVALAQGGAVDAVNDGRSGLLLSNRATTTLTDALSDLLADESRRNWMATAAVQWAAGFGWPETFDRLLRTMTTTVPAAQSGGRP